MEQLSEKKADEIRREVLTAIAAFDRYKEKGKPRIFDHLANGFLILLAGSFITYCAVPHYQRQRDKKDLSVKSQQECLTQFLSYANSIWREYYLLPPLVTKVHLTETEYADQLRALTAIKLDRYQAFAKLEALAIAYRWNAPGPSSGGRSEIEATLHAHAVQMNEISGHVDRWLRNLYCSAADCADVVDDASVDSPAAFESLKQMVMKFESRSQAIAERLVDEIQRTTQEN